MTPQTAATSAPGTIGQELHDAARLLFPICRSITGDGVRETLAILRERFVSFDIHEIPSGTSCFDWTVPEEWNIDDARLTGPDGETIVDFRDNALHVVGYSKPVDFELELDELQSHLHSLESQPEAIPYVTSYYQRDWGFCLPHAQREQLKPGRYRATIDSRFTQGSLTYGDLIIPGTSQSEILISSYICHPSMANNELSGPLVASALARWLSQRENRYTYRIALFPETIGSIAYLSRHLAELQKNVVAGFHLSCIGDERGYGFVTTPAADTLADRIARHVYRHTSADSIEYDFNDRGSDERQFCAPRVALPVVTLMRSKFGAYPEYHTSLDDLTLVTPAGLQGGFSVAKACIEAIEANRIHQTQTVGEPFLSKYGLRPTTSGCGLDDYHKTVSDILAYSDGKTDLLEICERINLPIWEAASIVETLASHSLLREHPAP